VRRRVAGIVLCLAGCALLSYGFARYAAGSLRADAARRIWNEQMASARVDELRRSALAFESAPAPIAGAPMARLEIPRIGLDDIVLEGVDDEALNAGPGHLPGSAIPGDSGNAVISAHRDRHFRRMGEVQLGDTIITETRDARIVWVVAARHVVGASTPALFRSATPTLTLTTCWPLELVGSAPERLLITARAVSVSRT
jgi:sortase A